MRFSLDGLCAEGRGHEVDRTGSMVWNSSSVSPTNELNCVAVAPSSWSVSNFGKHVHDRGRSFVADGDISWLGARSES